MTRTRAVLFALALALPVALLAACGDDSNDRSGAATDVADGQLHPDVVDVSITAEAAHVFGFDVTVSSRYDSPDRYADAWRVVGPDGTVHGTREPAHDHADEQPFTRSLSGAEIAADLATVVVEARDLANGWGGATADVAVPHRKS